MGIVHVPAVQTRPVAHTRPQAPQFVVLAREASHPFVARPSQSP
jgi:hypothetical protein